MQPVALVLTPPSFSDAERTQFSKAPAPGVSMPRPCPLPTSCHGQPFPEKITGIEGHRNDLEGRVFALHEVDLGFILQHY